MGGNLMNGEYEILEAACKSRKMGRILHQTFNMDNMNTDTINAMKLIIPLHFTKYNRLGDNK